MTVAELIEALQACDEGAEVRIATSGGVYTPHAHRADFPRSQADIDVDAAQYRLDQDGADYDFVEEDVVAAAASLVWIPTQPPPRDEPYAPSFAWGS